MALPVYGSIGAITTGGASGEGAPYPSGIAAGDKLFLHVFGKVNSSGTLTVNTPSGWTFEGSVVANDGTNRVSSHVFSKTATGSESGSLVFTFSSPNLDWGYGYIVRYTVTSGALVSIAAATGKQDTGSSTTAISITCGSDPGITANDLVLAFAGDWCVSNSQSWSAEAVSATGVTFGTMVERRDAATFQGFVLSEHPASSGTSSAAPVWTATKSSSSTHCVPLVLLRIRELSPISATLSTTLADATLSSAATSPIKATTAGTLADATLSATATSPIKATLTRTLGDAALSSSGTSPVKATVSVTLSDATLSAAATSKVSAALASTLANATLSATATSKISASASITLADATLTAGATSPIKATVTATLEDAALSSSASSPVKAAISATLDDATLAATATSPIKATATVTLDDASLSSSATSKIAATTTVTLEGAALSSTATSPIKATLSTTLANATLSSAATSPVKAEASATLENAVLSSNAVSPIKATLTATLEDATLDSTGSSAPDLDPATATLSVTLEDATLSSSATSPIRATLSVTLQDAALLAIATGATKPARLRISGRPALDLRFAGLPALTLTFRATRPDMINVGDDFPLSLEVTSIATGDHADPGTLRWFVRRPDKTDRTYVHGVDSESVRTAEGLYVLNLFLDQAGPWKVVADVTGAVRGREPWEFEARGTIADEVFA